MGGLFGKNKKELEREEELKKMIAARIALFNKPPEPEESSDEDSYHSEEPKKVPKKQLELTEKNVKVNARKIVAEPGETKSAGNVDGPTNILNDRMMKMLEFMLDPEFNKGPLTLRTLLTTTDQRSSKAFSDAVNGIGGILVVVESKKGHVFGAYIEDKFQEGGGWRRGSDENFIFSIGNITEIPLKMFANPERKYSYYSDCTRGFYAGQGKFDLSAFSARYLCLKPVAYTLMAPGYNEKFPINIEDGVLCGTPGQPHYEPKCMEVFAVTHYEDPKDPEVQKRKKEKEKLEAQKLVEKEKRAKQRRLERKLKKERMKKAAKIAAENKANGSNEAPTSFVHSTEN